LTYEAETITCPGCRHEYQFVSHEECPSCGINFAKIVTDSERHEALRMQLPWYSKIATKNYARTAWVAIVAYVIARIFSVLTSATISRDYDWTQLKFHLNPMNGNLALNIITGLLFIFTLFRCVYGEPREILTSVIKIVVLLTVIGNLFGEPYGLFNPDKPTATTITTVIAQFIAFNFLLLFDMHGSSLEAAQRADQELGITTDASHLKRFYWFRYLVVASLLYVGIVVYANWRSNQPEPSRPWNCHHRVSVEYARGNLSDKEYLEKLKAECGENN